MSSTKEKDANYKGVYYRKKKNGDTVYYVRFKHNNKTIERTVEATSPYNANSKRNELMYEYKNPNATTNPYRAKAKITLRYVFEKYCNDSLKYGWVKERTLSSKRSLFKKFANLHDMDIRDITKENIEDCILEANVQSNTTYNNCANFIGMMFNFANNNDIVACTNKAASIKRKSEDSEREAVLNSNEAKKLIEKLKELKQPQLWLFTLIALNTGVRLSEACRITREDVNIKKREIRIYNQKRDRYYIVDIRDKLYEPLKYRCERIDYNTRVLDYDGNVDLIKQIQRKLQNVLNNMFNRKKMKNSAILGYEQMDDIERNKAIAEMNTYLKFKLDYLRDNSDIFEYENNIKYKYVIHSLRHSYATILLNEANYSIYEVKEMLNHGSVRTTERYTKVVRDKEKNRKDIF